MNQIWISLLSKFGFFNTNVFVPNCVANACPNLAQSSCNCSKYVGRFPAEKAIHAQNPVCPTDPRKMIAFGQGISLYIIPISSQQRSQPRRAGFEEKIFQISVPMTVRFLQDFSQNLLLLNSGISLGKKMGKKQFFLYVAPVPIGTTQYMSTLLYLVAGV